MPATEDIRKERDYRLLLSSSINNLREGCPIACSVIELCERTEMFKLPMVLGVVW